MQLRIKKKSTGEAVMTWVRADGSSTTGRLGRGGFGAVHDLTHFVVEDTLPLRSGFFGLVAKGWNIPDFEASGVSVRLPDEAIVAECVVGQLSNAVFSGTWPDAKEFNWLMAQAIAGVRPGASAPVIGAETLARMRERLTALVGQWKALTPGETLELEFAIR